MDNSTLKRRGPVDIARWSSIGVGRKAQLSGPDLCRSADIWPEDYLFAALAAGASGFLLKDVRAEQLLEAVLAVSRGEGRLDPAITGTVVKHFRQHSGPTPGRLAPQSLTGREQEVLSLLTKGMSNAEIAAELHVAPRTVKTHVATVLAKLGVLDRVQAVIAAYETGLVRP